MTLPENYCSNKTFTTNYVILSYKKHDRNGRLIREVEINEIRLIGISSKIFLLFNFKFKFNGNGRMLNLF